MEELIQLITKQLGLNASVATGAVDRVAAILKQYAGEDLFKQLAAFVPGFDSAAQSGARALTSETASPSLMGSLAKLAASALGGSKGKAFDITRVLLESGVPADKLGQLLKTVVDFLRSKAGPDIVDQLLARFPLLKQLLA
jgi:hypothetical protein